MKNKISWDKALGIGVEIAPVGRRGKNDGHAYYSDLALKWETWLRDVKGYPENQLVPHELNNQLRSEFFIEHIESHPEWFTEADVKFIDVQGKMTYVCSGCHRALNGNYLYTCKCN
ncbi:hypothetical protein [Sporosarcina highlanderae]|uniref:Uncharacterized protein n=1 Tax=Sporosarcina highlanderae TaxID=3035916 RepID=A0ABT8JQD0_9BACL|nr:hypothetical protein [Sporosarcina highlanderae]MDN4607360.1 hypothetical protein [Sporosarcina highlanderae]